MTFDRFLMEACPGLDLEWRKYRRRSAKHRVDSRMRELGVADYSSYLELIRSDGKEASRLPDLMLVTVSRFFREYGVWRVLKDVILPGLIAARSADRMIRAWSAGCCGGEEPYTLALVWLEYIQPLHPGWPIEILATDIDDESLERAERALYGYGSLREVPAEIRERRFFREQGLWRLDEETKGLVRLEKRNLMTDPPPEAMDLVLCRYLAFTYYRGARLYTAANRLWEALRPEGVLIVGRKEVLPPAVLELFEPWPGCSSFYRKKG